MAHLLVVDDHTIFRQAIARCVGDSHIVHHARNGEEALAVLGIQPIDVLLLDIEMPVMNGIETMGHVRKNYPATKVIIVTQLEEAALVIYFLKLGANAFLLKNCELAELEMAIAETLAKGEYYNEKVMEVVKRNLLLPKDFPNLSLSPRESQVLLHIKEGKSNKEMASILGLELLTIESYRKSLMHKTKCRNAAELVVFALRIGFKYTGSPLK